MFGASDTLEFAKKYELLTKEQKKIIDFGSFCGTFDEYSLAVGYNAPAPTQFRKCFDWLVEHGIASYQPEDYIDSIQCDGRICKSEPTGNKHTDSRRKCFIIEPLNVVILRIFETDYQYFMRQRITTSKNQDNRKRENDNRKRNHKLEKANREEGKAESCNQ